MAQSQTCKAHAIDELSLIMLIENEVTKKHKCHTMEEAIASWKTLYRHPSLKSGLGRDRVVGSIVITRNMLSEAVSYDVMLAKMLQTIPKSKRLEIVSEQDGYGWALLHIAVCESNVVSVTHILSIYPESLHIQAVSMKDSFGMTVLHQAAVSSNPSILIKMLLNLYPETEYFQAVNARDKRGNTVLHRAIWSIDLLKCILSLLPENQRNQIVSEKDRKGRSPLHLASEMHNLCSIWKY